MKPRVTDASLVVAICGALLLAALSLVAYALADAHRAVREPYADLQGRYARLAGLRELTPQIERSVADLTERLSGQVHGASVPSERIGTDLQQRVRRVAEEAGMTVTGSQILPARTASGFTQIPVTLTAGGSMEGLQAMLIGLGMERPSILVDSMVIEGPGGETSDGARLTAQMNLSVLQVRQ